VPASIPRPEYVDRPAPAPYDGPEVKDAETIERMRAAGRLAARALREVGRHVAPGVTTHELDRGGHESWEKGACVMEAVAYVAGEPFSDHPACASPVITSFLISWNDSLPDDQRQMLKPYIPRIVGTKTTG